MSVYFTAGPDCEIVVWSSETGPSVERQILRNVQPGSAGYTIKPLPRLHCLCTTIFIGFRTAGRVKTLRAEPFGAVVLPWQLQLIRCTT